MEPPSGVSKGQITPNCVQCNLRGSTVLPFLSKEVTIRRKLDNVPKLFNRCKTAAIPLLFLDKLFFNPQLPVLRANLMSFSIEFGFNFLLRFYLRKNRDHHIQYFPNVYLTFY